MVDQRRRVQHNIQMSPFGRLMNATGLPANTIGAGGNPPVVVGDVIDHSTAKLEKANNHGRSP